jgi:wyosine [tRNA(Phe)-imidazoG37] synthetase (radical SAM superfamily)
LRQFQSHPRRWRENLFVYPVLSRRSGGLSIGINLNPDMACNFDCVYCQVDRSVTPRVRDVDVDRLSDELAGMIQWAQSGALFGEPEFADVPNDHRRISDIAFSGDGEPTTCKVFDKCVTIAAQRKQEAGLRETKIVLITDACYLTKPHVVAGLRIMDAHLGQIWAKLDAGTEDYYQEVNRPNFPLQHVVDNIVAAARDRSIVIQSLFMRLHGRPPDEAELHAFVGRLNEITGRGGRIEYVQVYTIARPPAQSFVTALCDDEVDRIVRLVREGAGLIAEPFYAPGPQ